MGFKRPILPLKSWKDSPGKEPQANVDKDKARSGLGIMSVHEPDVR
jgi:hypothetical protein